MRGKNHGIAANLTFDNRSVYRNTGISQTAPLYLYPTEFPHRVTPPNKTPTNRAASTSTPSSTPACRPSPRTRPMTPRMRLRSSTTSLARCTARPAAPPMPSSFRSTSPAAHGPPRPKWLYDRKGRALRFDDVKHHQRILKIRSETDRIMQTITMTLEAS